jgi:hypothetical protein
MLINHCYKETHRHITNQTHIENWRDDLLKFKLEQHTSQLKVMSVFIHTCD